MLTLNYTGLDPSLFLVGVGNATDSILYINLLAGVLEYQVWLLVVTGVFLLWFVYTRNLILALITMIGLGVNMYVFQYTAFDDVTKLLMRGIFLLLIVFVAVFMLYDRRRRYGHYRAT